MFIGVFKKPYMEYTLYLPTFPQVFPGVFENPTPDAPSRVYLDTSIYHKNQPSMHVGKYTSPMDTIPIIHLKIPMQNLRP